MERSSKNLKNALADPVQFARDLLGHDTWNTQEAILRSVAKHRRTAVRACHGSSKSFTAAEAALWWAARYRDGKVIITASTFSQVRNVIWAEVHRNLRLSRFPFPVQANQTELRLSDSNFVLGLSTDQGVRFQGFHGGHVLIIIDEAPGVDAEIWEAIEGVAAAGDVHILALGNPTIASGPFFDAFGRNRASWKTFTIDAFETPNLEGLSIEDLIVLPDDELDRNSRPYLITRRWVREKYDAWWNGSAESSPLWQSRVRGQFPLQSANALIALSWLERAQTVVKDDDRAGVYAGVDIAGPGSDLTVVQILSTGGAVLETKAWAHPDPRGEVVAMLNYWRPRLSSVRVDSAGVGYNFGLHLRDQKFPVELVNVGTSPSDPDRFANLKAELFWQMRERFRDGTIANLASAETIAQLSGIQYGISPTGKIVIESKDEMRKRGLKSPDHAEALMLAIGPMRSRFEFLRAPESGSRFSALASNTKRLSLAEQDRLDDLKNDIERRSRSAGRKQFLFTDHRSGW